MLLAGNPNSAGGFADKSPGLPGWVPWVSDGASTGVKSGTKSLPNSGHGRAHSPALAAELAPGIGVRLTVPGGSELPETVGPHPPVATPERTDLASPTAAPELLPPAPRPLEAAGEISLAVVNGVRLGERLLAVAEIRRYNQPGKGGQAAAQEGPESLETADDKAHFVEFHFTGTLPSSQLRFRYRLSGFDHDWQEAGDKRVATYAYLPLGDYVFEVQAGHGGGVWQHPGAIFRFSLVPHFYKSWWFFSACFVGLQAMVLLFARQHFRSNEQRLRGDRLALEQERSRIARDLHDDLGANLTGLAMQAEIAGTTLTGPGAEELRRFAVTTRGLAQRLREVIWAVDPESDTLESLTSFLGQQTDQMLGPTRLRYRFDVPPHLPVLRLRAGTRHQLAMSAREALNNVLKYSQATEVQVNLALADEILSISIQDNGVGLPTGSVTASGKPVLGGNGLKNIRQRLQSLGGNFRLSSAAGAGTLVRLEVPLAAVAAVESKSEQATHEHQSRDRRR